MTFGDMGSYAILNPYDVLYLPLKFVPLITNHPILCISDFTQFWTKVIKPPTGEVFEHLKFFETSLKVCKYVHLRVITII